MHRDGLSDRVGDVVGPIAAPKRASPGESPAQRSAALGEGLSGQVRVIATKSALSKCTSEATTAGVQALRTLIRTASTPRASSRKARLRRSAMTERPVLPAQTTSTRKVGSGDPCRATGSVPDSRGRPMTSLGRRRATGQWRAVAAGKREHPRPQLAVESLRRPPLRVRSDRV